MNNQSENVLVPLDTYLKYKKSHEYIAKRLQQLHSEYINKDIELENLKRQIQDDNTLYVRIHAACTENSERRYYKLGNHTIPVNKKFPPSVLKLIDEHLDRYGVNTVKDNQLEEKRKQINKKLHHLSISEQKLKDKSRKITRYKIKYFTIGFTFTLIVYYIANIIF